MLHPFVVQLILILLKIVCLLIAIAYYTIAERKIMAAIQRRRGPNVVGFWGLLQPLADGLKLVAKEMIIPSHSNSRIFVVAPLTILTLGLLSWSILPFGCFDYSEHMASNDVIKAVFANAVSTDLFQNVAFGKLNYNAVAEANDISNVRYGLLVILALSSLTVYGLIIAGWASNSKYAFLGALRSAAQMISYEVSISLVIIPVIFMSGSLNFTEIVSAQLGTIYYFFPLVTLSIIFFISMIAETNRTPFDLPEAEAELVAGYNIEYSSIIFAMFFLAEYGNMIMMSLIKSELFIGGWGGLENLPLATSLAFKALIFCFAFVLVRATFPRYRYDQLMDIGWKIFLPVSTGLLLLVIGVILAYSATPVVGELNFLPYAEPQLGSAEVLGPGILFLMPLVGVLLGTLVFNKLVQPELIKYKVKASLNYIKNCDTPYPELRELWYEKAKLDWFLCRQKLDGLETARKFIIEREAETVIDRAVAQVVKKDGNRATRESAQEIIENLNYDQFTPMRGVEVRELVFKLFESRCELPKAADLVELSFLDTLLSLICKLDEFGLFCLITSAVLFCFWVHYRAETAKRD